MAESDEAFEETTDQELEQEGEEVGRPDERRRKKCCSNQRLDELSRPNKRMFLALWNEHAHHLPKDKVKNLKVILQQLYAMSPEETAKYFAELRAEARTAALQKKLKQKLRKYLLKKHMDKQRSRAYKLFQRLLKCGIAYAAENPVPPLVSIRLRYLSDIILEQLCDLRKLKVPIRSNPDKLGQFLISVADWMAIAVERLYYATELSVNEITGEDKTEKAPDTYDKFGEPIASSTPQKLSLAEEKPVDKSMTVPKTYEDLTQPIGASSPKRLSLKQGGSADKTPKKYESIQRQSSALERLSLSQEQAETIPRKPSMDPFYSFMTTARADSLAEKSPQSQVPYYNLSHMKHSTECKAALSKPKLEFPPYGFGNLSKSYRQSMNSKAIKSKKRSK